MIICDEIYPKICDEICEILGACDIELVFVGSDEMKELNLSARGLDKTTDVLSFPYEKVPNFPLGSVVINRELSQSVAESLGHSFDEEIGLLFLHGTLHILGFDHEIDNGEMREKERQIIEKLSLPKSLIIRSEN